MKGRFRFLPLSSFSVQGVVVQLFYLPRLPLLCHLAEVVEAALSVPNRVHWILAEVAEEERA